MNQDLKLLLELQEIDIKIIELENSKEEFPITVERLEKEIATQEESIKKAEIEIDTIKKERLELEENILNYSLSLEKSQERLSTIKTNKEYDAIHAEIESLKHISASAEKQLHKITTTLAGLENSLNDAHNAFEKISQEYKPQIKELKEKISSIDSVIAEVNSGKVAISEKINKPFLRAYSYIRSSRKKGKVIGLVSNEERNCTICYQVLQPQVVNTIRMGRDIIYCRNCGSILIWQEYMSENAKTKQN